MRFFLCLAVAAASISVSAEDRTLEHVFVTVPIHRQEANSMLPVTVITNEELQRSVATTIGETLGNRAGLANSSFGPGVGRPVIRGQQGPRAITLQNNTSSADVSSFSPDHAVTVEPMLARSIEVLRGPSTLLYGGGAIGGIVNVIDNRIPRERIEGIEGAAEYRYDYAPDLNSGVGLLEAGFGNFAFHLSGTSRSTSDLRIPGRAIDEAALAEQEKMMGHDEEHEGEDHEGEDHDEEEVNNSKGKIANTDTDTDVITAGFSFHFDEKGSYAGFAVNNLNNKYGIPPGAHEHGHEEEHGEHEGEEHEGEEHEGEEEEEEIVRIDMDQTRYDAMLHLYEPMDSIEVVRGFLTYTDYEHKELEGSEVGTRFKRDTWEGRLEVVHSALLGTEGAIGLQAKSDEFEAVGEEGYIPQTDSTELGLFLIEDFHRNEWTYEVGLRGEYVERDPSTDAASKEDFTNWSASLSALWQFDDNWQTGVSLARSARAPSTEELFSNVDAMDPEELVTHAATGIIEVGDPDLDNETSLNADLALQWHSANSWAELSVFYNHFDDYIFLRNTGEEVDEIAVYDYLQEDTKFYGVEFESSFHLTDLGPGALALDLRGDAIRGDFDDSGDVPRLPPVRIGGRLNWTGDAFGAWLSVLNAGDQDRPGDFETDTDGYTRWDLGADYRFTFAQERELLVFMKWKNITDEEIRLSTSFLRNYAPEAGQSVAVGIRFSF